MIAQVAIALCEIVRILLLENNISNASLYSLESITHLSYTDIVNIIPSSLKKNFLIFSSMRINARDKELHIKISRAENGRHVRARRGAADENEGVPSAESDREGEDGSGQGHQQAQRSGEGLHLSSAGRCTRRLHVNVRQENGRGQHFRYIRFNSDTIASRKETLRGSLFFIKIKYFCTQVVFSLKVFLCQLCCCHFSTRKTKIIFLHIYFSFESIFSPS